MEYYKEIWENFCEKIKMYKGYNEIATQIHSENFFEDLGWKRKNGEIARPPISFGASNSGIPDIVLRKDNEYQLVIELKRYLAGISERNKEQLQSYMRALKLEFGLLIGNTLQVYYDDKSKNNNGIEKVCEIMFNNNSELGIKLTELLAKENFSQEKFKEFCFKQLATNSKEKEIDDKINFLCSPEGIQHIKELLINEYPEEVVNRLIISIKDTTNEGHVKPGRKPIFDTIKEKPQNIDYKEEYYKFLRYKEKHTPATTNSYISAINNVVVTENYKDWSCVVDNIEKLIEEYDKFGSKAEYGAIGHNTVICSLKKFYQFLKEYNK